MHFSSGRKAAAVLSSLPLALALCFASAPQASAQAGPPAAPPAQAENGPFLTEGGRYLNPNLERYPDQTAAEVQEAISTLPGYTVFDNIEFKINAGLNQVTLLGQVTNPVLARDAVNIVRSIPGIRIVNNHIGLLPASRRDARLRQAAYQAVYGNADLSRYRVNHNPPIHIVVDNGRITLIGVVGTQHDRKLVYQQTSDLAGVASAKNDLTVDPYAASAYTG